MRVLLLALLLGGLSLAAVRFGPALLPTSMRPVTPARPAAPALPPARTEAAGGGEAEVTTSVRYERYGVHGATAADLLASLRQNGPQSQGETFFGLTATEMRFRYLRQPEADGCTVQSVQIDLDVTITLPEWAGSGDAAYEVRRDWHRFLSALQRHEDAHRAVAEAGAELVRQSLEGLRRPTCEAADAEAQRVAERIRIETEAAQRNLDDRTNHGKTEGAVWPL